MSDVDALQEAEEQVAQMDEERERVAREALIEDLHADPVKATASHERSPERIPLGNITGGANMRTGDLPEIQGMAISIREVGLIHPLLVRAEGEDAYRLVAGRRRLAALQLVFEPQDVVHCEVLSSDADESEQWVLMLTENLQRENPAPMQVARGLRAALRLDPDLKASALARTLGKSPAWASRHLHLLDLSEEVQWRLESGDLNFTIADLVRQGLKNGVIKDDDEALAIADDVVSGETTPLELKKLVRPRTRTPDVPEDYDEISVQLDAARGGIREGGSEANEPSEDGEDQEATRKRRRATAKKGAARREHSARHLESYLIGRLLRDDASATLLRRLEVTSDQAYSYAWGLGTDSERLGVLHELAADLASQDKDLPADIFDR
jgi:ParB family chromosome partitioning protein